MQIDHVPITATPEEILNNELANKSTVVLGYNPKNIPLFGKLAQTLKQLDIHPLDKTQVQRYRAKKAKKSLSNVQKVAFAVLAVTGLVAIFSLANMDMHIFNVAPTLSVSAIVVIGLWVGFAIWQDNVMTIRKETYWTRVSIRNWDRYIPAHIVQKAIEIQTALPMVDLSVDYLQEKETRYAAPRTLRDPFLVAELDRNELFYIDVWEEPEFEAKMVWDK